MAQQEQANIDAFTFIGCMVLKSLALCAELSTGGIFMRFQSRLPMSVDTACPRSSVSSNSRSSCLPPASSASLLISTLSPRSILLPRLRRRLLTITVLLLLPCTHPTVIQIIDYLQLMMIDYLQRIRSLTTLPCFLFLFFLVVSSSSSRTAGLSL
jgi:hypothetical protein